MFSVRYTFYVDEDATVCFEIRSDKKMYLGMYLILANGTHLTECEEGSMKWMEKTEIFLERDNFLILDLKGKIKYTLIPSTEAEKVNIILC